MSIEGHVGTNSIYIPSLCDGDEWALPRSEPAMERIGVLDGRSRKPDWQPVVVNLLRSMDGEALVEADFPWFCDHALVLRRRAVEAFAPVEAWP